MAKQDLASNDILKINSELTVETKLRLCGQFKLKELQGVEKIVDISFAETEDQIDLLAVLAWQLDQTQEFDVYKKEVMQLDINDMLTAMDEILVHLNAKLKNQSGSKQNGPKTKNRRKRK